MPRFDCDTSVLRFETYANELAVWCNKNKVACIALIIQHMPFARRRAFRTDIKKKELTKPNKAKQSLHLV